ncbi:MAG: DEAD/DEAH box helicase [Ruminiclostridium sp.]|jgi:ATP-dependent RNA helicase DeaD|nr:DEAD/DEAH box helicase [Ruminiclostridium sp.]MCI9465730.1 DEAD/DEAH box helicase [Ruminiclostridium sp.]
MEINGTTVELDLRYSEMNLSPGLLRALDEKGFTLATPVQAGAIPCFKDWKDVIAKAPTGSGKTFAFGIPMVEHTNPQGLDVTGLILAPTRELAMQIQDELRQLCAFLPGIRVACLYGGQPIERQINLLKKRPQIVVATPGRLMDHMKRRTVRLHKVETVVLDEADRMLDMGFIKDVTHILKQIPNRRNLGMFSATISREVMDISWVYQRDPVEIVVRPLQENRPKISQYRLKVDLGGKVDLLTTILETQKLDRVIVFCNTKNNTDRITGLLRMRQISAQCIHGDLGQKVREQVLTAFRKGELRVLVATDVAARGLDIDDVDAVINYDIPEEGEYYVHRIGRTGRAKHQGAAYNLLSSITEEIRLDEIARNNKYEIKPITL